MLLCYFIHRFVRFWGNTPGQCFRLNKPPVDDNAVILVHFAAASIVFDICVEILIYARIYAQPRDRIDAVGQDIKAQNALEEATNTLEEATNTMEEVQKALEEGQKELEESRNALEESRKELEESRNALEESQKELEEAQNALREKFQNAWPIMRVLILATNALEGCILLINSAMGIAVVLANQTQIVGDENSFSFGQVTALVTLVASFYKIGDSLYSKPCVPS